MKHILNFKYNGYFIISIFIISILMSILNILELILSKGTNIISFILILLVSLILSFKTGKKTNKKGYICGLLFGLTNILLMFVLNIILFNNEFSLNMIFYYLIILFINILGSMFGKTKKEIN